MRFRPSPLLALALVSCVATDRPTAPAAPPGPLPPSGGEALAESREQRAPALVASTLQVPSASSPTADPAPAAPVVAPRVEREPERRTVVDEAMQRAIDVAKRKLDEHDFAAARAIIEDWMTSKPLADARMLLSQQRADEALVVTREAVALAPNEPRVLLLHAEACLQSGLIHAERSRLEDALRVYQLVGASPEALFGASRAARALGANDVALQLARDGWAAWQAQGAPDRALFEAPERTVERATWNAFDAASRDELDADARSALQSLAADTQLALTRTLTQHPDDADAWTRLAEVDLRMAQPGAARATLTQALRALPTNVALAARLVEVAREVGGFEGVLESFASLRASGVDSAILWKLPALERFEHALAQLAERPLMELGLAESEFATARALDLDMAPECLRHEALCRNARGWIHLQAGELDAAKDAFRSIEKLVPGGLGFDLPTRLRAGTRGLADVAQAHVQRDEIESAAKLYAELHKYQRDDVEWATRAGAAYRDAADRMALLALDCRLAAQGRVTDPRRLASLRERAAIPTKAEGAALATEFRLAADEWSKKARKWFETARTDFLDALRLAPNDARLMNEAALIAIDRLGTDLEDAESLLQRSIKVAQKALAQGTLDDAARRATLQAQGDAHEYLGMLYLERTNEVPKAVHAFETALEIGPGPRPAISESYLPRCRELLQSRL